MTEWLATLAEPLSTTSTFTSVGRGLYDPLRQRLSAPPLDPQSSLKQEPSLRPGCCCGLAALQVSC